SERSPTGSAQAETASSCRSATPPRSPTSWASSPLPAQPSEPPVTTYWHNVIDSVLPMAPVSGAASSGCPSAASRGRNPPGQGTKRRHPIRQQRREGPTAETRADVGYQAGRRERPVRRGVHEQLERGSVPR